MTQKEGGGVGQATVSMLDRDNLDTDGNILFEFKPPNKQFDSDIHSRSGGEKTVAALALVFAMASSKKPSPPFILLDEVDAHLDQENVELLSSFLAKWDGP